MGNTVNKLLKIDFVSLSFKPRVRAVFAKRNHAQHQIFYIGEL